MRLMPKLSISAAILTLSIIGPVSRAAVITQTYSGSYPGTISGTLPDQGSVLEEAFTVTTASDFTAFTTSYATGGFQPNLTLYDPSGVADANGTQGPKPPAGATADPTSGKILDGYLMVTDLQPGTYTLTLTDFNLSQSVNATNLSDGFASNSGDGVNFIDFYGNTRTGAYSVNVNLTPVNATATPEPATFYLMAPFLLLGLGMLARKHLPNQN